MFCILFATVGKHKIKLMPKVISLEVKLHISWKPNEDKKNGSRHVVYPHIFLHIYVQSLI